VFSSEIPNSAFSCGIGGGVSLGDIISALRLKRTFIDYGNARRDEREIGRVHREEGT
jgi:hypothetical protein